MQEGRCSPPDRDLLQLEALAVGALGLGGVGLVGTHLNGVQRTVVLGAAMVCAAGNGALDAGVGSIVSHEFVLLKVVFAMRRILVCTEHKNLCDSVF
jgi:hypothetical protein